VLVVPAWAVVNIAAVTEQVDVDGTDIDTDQVAITYELSGEAELARAFAIDITVAPQDGEPDGNCAPLILDINEAELNVDYWVYPGSIDINEAGAVNDVGTPIGDPCQLPSDTKGGLNTNAITIEMGSLYVGEANAPATSGVLLKLVVDDNCKITMAENVSRGGVVMEGVGAKTTVNFTPGSATLYTYSDAAEWRRVGQPKCWCRFKNPRQCKGDADGKYQGKFKYWVSTIDQDVVNAAWNQNLAAIAGQVEAGSGTPLICADFDHVAQGKFKYRVSTIDQDTVNANWQISNGPAIPASCP
jgi:hypothetical protein